MACRGSGPQRIGASSLDAVAHRILGAVLAGGRSRRFGSDKGAAVWQGSSLLDHTRRALTAQCQGVIVCAGENPVSAASPDALADRPGPDLGPLGGLCAALFHARDSGFTHVLTAPVDAHPTPPDLADLLAGGGPAVLGGQWLFGLWPSHLAARLEAHLLAGKRSVLSWVEDCGARRVDFPRSPPLNVNTPDMLAVLERASALDKTVEVHAAR